MPPICWAAISTARSSIWGCNPVPRVTYVDVSGASRTIDLALGENVMRGALYNGIPGIVGECGGALSCATCHCYVDDAWTARVGGPASHEERELLQSAAAEVRPNSRLGCQIAMTEALDGLIVHTPDVQY
jgi:2Fe-2S ferredoxin